MAFVQALRGMQPSDEYSIFGEYIASELRQLPPERASILKRQILIDLLNESTAIQVNCICKLWE